MEDGTFTIFAKEAFTVLDGRRVWRAASVFSVFFAAKHAFHSYPLRNYDILRVNPLEIFKAML
jgi:hypothetical protein